MSAGSALASRGAPSKAASAMSDDEHKQGNHSILEQGVREEGDAFLLLLVVLLQVLLPLLGFHGLLPPLRDGADPNADDQIHMEADQEKQAGGQHPDMDAVETRQRDRR